MAIPLLYLHGVAEIGGAERDLLALLRGLDRAKWSPIVACPGHGPLIDELKVLNVPVFPITFPAWRKVKDFPWRFPALIRLVWLVRTVKAAVIHVNDLWWAPYGCLAAKLCGVPSVVLVRQNLESRRVHQYYLDKADHVVAVAKTAALVLHASGIPQQRTRVIASGVDTKWFSQSRDRDGRACLGISTDSLVIGCLANVLAIKGHDLLIEAFSKVTREFPSACCLFVGREDGSPYGREVRTLADRLGLTDKIHFVGFQSDVRPYLAVMDCVALTSRSEGLPIALLEAMAMGKPVVSTRVGGISEVVEDGVTGLLVPPESSDSIAVALQTLLRDPTRRQEMGRAGRQRVLEQFDLNSTVEAFQHLYEDLLADEHH